MSRRTERASGVPSATAWVIQRRAARGRRSARAGGEPLSAAPFLGERPPLLTDGTRGAWNKG